MKRLLQNPYNLYLGFGAGLISSDQWNHLVKQETGSWLGMGTVLGVVMIAAAALAAALRNRTAGSANTSENEK